MENEKCVDVRVDFCKNGDFFPIEFIDANGETNYIKKIERVENRYIVLNKSQRYYYCITSKRSVILIFQSNKWYIKE